MRKGKRKVENTGTPNGLKQYKAIKNHGSILIFPVFPPSILLQESRCEKPYKPKVAVRSQNRIQRSKKESAERKQKCLRNDRTAVLAPWWGEKAPSCTNAYTYTYKLPIPPRSCLFLASSAKLLSRVYRSVRSILFSKRRTSFRSKTLYRLLFSRSARRRVSPHQHTHALPPPSFPKNDDELP